MQRSTFVLGGAGAVLSLRPRFAAAQPLALIRIATVPIDAGAQPYFARAMGFFDRAGLRVEITPLSNGAAVAAAVASGSMDIGQSNVVSVAQAHERGLPFAFIAGANAYTSVSHQGALVVTATSPIQTGRDLNGKTIAVSGLKNITQVGAETWIDQNGGNTATLKFVELPFPVMAEAIVAGRVDTALIATPELDDALATKPVRVLCYPYDAIAKEFVIGGWFSTIAWVKAHPDLARGYRAVMAQTARWANANQAQSAKILEQESGLHVAASAHRVPFAERLDPAGIQRVIDVSAKYGALKASFPAAEIIF